MQISSFVAVVFNALSEPDELKCECEYLKSPVAKGFFHVVIVLFYSPEGLVVTVPPFKQCFCLAYLSKKQLLNDWIFTN